MFKPTNGEFCAECGTILPLLKNALSNIQCSLCKKDWPIQIKMNQLIDKQEKSYVRTVADSETSALTQQDDLIQVEHICEKCGFNLASYTTQQTRSADEGQTVFYTCLK